MEKRTPHCKLAVIKSLLAVGRVRTTHAARAGVVAMGFSYDGLLDVVRGLSASDFYPSARKAPGFSPGMDSAVDVVGRTESDVVLL